MAQSTREFKYVHALPPSKQNDNDVRRIVSLHSRANELSSWSQPYKKHVTNKEVRSNLPVRKRIARMLQNVAAYGEDYYNKEPRYLKPVGDGLWQLKPKNHRLLMFLDEEVPGITIPCWLIVDAFKKPPAKKQDRYIQLAKRRMNQYWEWK